VSLQSARAIRVLALGGLRGEIFVALTLSLSAKDSRSLLLTLTYTVVIFSLLAQDLTVSRLIRRVTVTAGAAHADKDGASSTLHKR